MHINHIIKVIQTPYLIAIYLFFIKSKTLLSILWIKKIITLTNYNLIKNMILNLFILQKKKNNLYNLKVLLKVKCVNARL
jgi:hypothetical protein